MFHFSAQHINAKRIGFILALFVLFMSGCSMQPSEEQRLASQEAMASIANIKHPQTRIYASGQPSQEQLKQVQMAGIQHVISLRPASELDWDEAALVESLGMTFHNIPVAGFRGITADNARALQQLLQDLEGETILLHCSSGNRVGSLISLAEFENNGGQVEAAIQEGKRWGLTRLENKIRAKLNQ